MSRTEHAELIADLRAQSLFETSNLLAQAADALEAAAPRVVRTEHAELIANLQRLISPATDEDSIPTADALLWIEQAIAALASVSSGAQGGMDEDRAKWFHKGFDAGVVATALRSPVAPE